MARSSSNSASISSGPAQVGSRGCIANVLDLSTREYLRIIDADRVLEVLERADEVPRQRFSLVVIEDKALGWRGSKMLKRSFSSAGLCTDEITTLGEDVQNSQDTHHLSGGSTPERETLVVANPETEICYGMLINRLGEACSGVNGQDTQTSSEIDLAVEFEEGILLDLRGSQIGTLRKRTLQLFTYLCAGKGVSLQLYCVDFQRSADQCHKKPKTAKLRAPEDYLQLRTIIYGPQSLVETIGTFLSRCGEYLQHPEHCDRNVEYYNPHCLSEVASESVFTQQLRSVTDAPLHVEQYLLKSNLLSELENTQDIEETEASDALKTALFPHQKQALTFMDRRERGWALETPLGDLWSQESTSYGRYQFVNNITGCIQDVQPPQFRGGILADQMGLGKSLAMIALITYRQWVPLKDQNTSLSNDSSAQPTLVPVKSTLLIVPLGHVAKILSSSYTIVAGPAKESLKTWVDTKRDLLWNSEEIDSG
ncbi:MAG: hypothetical protein M1833_000592 [Piccolia ochrophora]|nr:MAG: hypothetical protein M1833_000592 [Piccolia ochrophora]